MMGPQLGLSVRNSSSDIRRYCCCKVVQAQDIHVNVTYLEHELYFCHLLSECVANQSSFLVAIETNRLERLNQIESKCLLTVSLPDPFLEP